MLVLEKPLYDRVRRLAAKEEISLSLKIRDLIKDALEAEEDIAAGRSRRGTGKDLSADSGTNPT